MGQDQSGWVLSRADAETGGLGKRWVGLTSMGDWLNLGQGAEGTLGRQLSRRQPGTSSIWDQTGGADN